MSKDLAVIPIGDIQQMAVAVAKSGLFGMKTPDQALALMLIAQAEGLHPAIAARDYHIIEGRPSLKADAMLARFQAAGGSVKWPEMTDQRVAGIFSHPQGGTVEIDWTIETAKRAGLGPGKHRNGSDNMWSKYPRQMLRARVISEGVRAVYPGVVVGMYTEEEVNDSVEESHSITTGKIVDAEIVEEKDPVTDAYFEEKFIAWEGVIIKGTKTPQQLIDFLEGKGVVLADHHKTAIKAVKERKDEAA